MQWRRDERKRAGGRRCPSREPGPGRGFLSALVLVAGVYGPASPAVAVLNEAANTDAWPAWRPGEHYCR